MAESDKPSDIYVFDASSWISIEGDPKQNRILHDLIPLIEAGRIKCPPEAWEELRKCDWVLAWIKDHRKKIVVSRYAASYFETLGDVFIRFPGMCRSRGSKEKADGYVVALAAHKNGNPTKWTVVASETLASRPNRKIPRACQHYGVEPIGLMEMLRREYPDGDY